METAAIITAIIGTLFIAVVIFLAIHWTYRRPKFGDGDDPPVDPELREYMSWWWWSWRNHKRKGDGDNPTVDAELREYISWWWWSWRGHKGKGDGGRPAT